MSDINTYSQACCVHDFKFETVAALLDLLDERECNKYCMKILYKNKNKMTGLGVQ